MMEKLKSCPFCGSDNIIIEGGRGSMPVFWPICNNCGAECNSSFTREGAIKKWNTRAVLLEADYQTAYNDGYSDGYDNAIENVTEMLKNCPPSGGAHKKPGKDPEKEGTL